MDLKETAQTLASIISINVKTEPATIADACVLYYAAQTRSKALTAERDELRITMGFAATMLRDAVLAVGQHQKKFGDYTVHLSDSWDVYCKGCGTFATGCGCEGGPVEVSSVYKPRIWISKASNE